MIERMRAYLRSEGAAVMTEWVAASAVIILITMLTYLVVQSGATDTATTVGTTLSQAEVETPD